MLVLDTSAVLEALVAVDPPSGLIDRLADDGDLNGPHLIDTEVLHVLRRMSMSGELSDERAEDARSDFAELAIVRYPHEPLNGRVWELRHDMTAYDATFVALAEMLGVPLITCDARLASASGSRARVELYGNS